MLRISILIFASLLFVRCANIVNPTGGPKDTTVPKVLLSYPRNGQTNYKGNSITLTMDEYIADNQIASKILVSPTINGLYTVRVKKDILKLTWKDTLKENTTYTFNFIDGIKDLTEGNSIRSYSVTFSTGKDLDSNSLDAVIKSQPGEQLNPNYKILLFDKTDSILTLLRKTPEYVGILNDSGKIKMNFLKEKDYTALALNDINKNNKWDKAEPLGIKNTTIKNSITEEFNVQPTKLDTAKLISTNSLNKYVNLLFSKGLQKINIKDTNGTYLLAQESSRKYYIQNQYNLEDSTKIQIEYVDSMGINGAIEKTIKFKSIDIQKDKDSIINIKNIDRKYVLSPKLDSIQFSVDKLINDFELNIVAPKNISYTLTNHYTYFVIKFSGQKELDSIKINIPYKSLNSINKEYNKEFNQTIVTGEEKDFGNLHFILKTESPNYIAYFENQQNTIVYTSKNKPVNNIKNLMPGEYKLFVHVDSNNDGIWNAFDPVNNIPAEPIYYFKEKLIIRPNWDLEDIQMIF